jgi:hypothetical protein
MTTAAEVLGAVEHYFPGLGPAVDCALSVAATPLLKDNANPVAVVYVGVPSSSKTTVVDMLDGHPAAYRSDNFTPASFVSHASNVDRKHLEKVDLLPRIKHKVLLTPEMAPIFRGREDELTPKFSIITKVLDGNGLMTDSGTQGRRGYSGDYLFAWLGCTTPFGKAAWNVMGQLGSRLFFYRMDTDEDITVETLLSATEGVAYRERLRRCQEIVQRFLGEVTLPGVRGVEWKSADDARHVRQMIAWLAMALSAMRSQPRTDDEEARPELPYRAHMVLYNLARGHALVHGRRQLSVEDLPVVAKVALDSMAGGYGRVFAALSMKGAPLTVAEVAAVLSSSVPTARDVMEELERRGVMAFDKPGVGKTASLKFAPGWKVFETEPFGRVFRGLFSPDSQVLQTLGTSLKQNGRCDAPPCTDLKGKPLFPTLNGGEEEDEEGGEPHTAQIFSSDAEVLEWIEENEVPDMLEPDVELQVDDYGE